MRERIFSARVRNENFYRFRFLVVRAVLRALFLLRFMKFFNSMPALRGHYKTLCRLIFIKCVVWLVWTRFPIFFFACPTIFSFHTQIFLVWVLRKKTRF